MGTTKEAALKALLEIVDTLVEAVSEAGPMGIPEGHLYAQLMGHGCTLEQFTALVSAMTATGKVRSSGHCLYAA